MKGILLKKSKIFIIAIVLVGAGVLSNVGAISTENKYLQVKTQDITNFVNEETEYWALLVAVGVYADDPQQNRPLMLEEVDDLYDVLLNSPGWSEDHIKVLKGEDATIFNIIMGLRWLDKMEDSDDISLVFISTHGSPLGWDIPPVDEDDGTDEILVSYWGFAYRNLFIWDDELNFLLNRLESKGVCLIVDSCYAGGFNDPPDWNRTSRNILPFLGKDITMSSSEWMEGFAEEVRGQGRVVLMASGEDEVSFSGGFAPYLIDGLRGFADSNTNGIVSAEEAFYYTVPRTSRQHPTMYDGYEGELPLIDVTGGFQYTNEADNNDGKRIEKEQRGSQICSGDSPENSILCGYVKDIETENPIEDTLIELTGRDNEGIFFENYTTTDYLGFYSMNVPAGRVSLYVHADGYFSEYVRHINIDENETVWANFSLYPRPPENSILCGYVTDNETGDPTEGANVTLTWRGGQNQFYWNTTNSDPSGFFIMNVAAGEIDVEAEMEGYFRETFEDYIIEESEILWINFSLYPRPPENSIICGYVTDNETGDPIENAFVDLEWVDFGLDHEYYNESRTDESGFYSMNVAAGEIYLDIRTEGYERYSSYRFDTVENKTLWVNVSLEKETIDVDIAKPLRALYLNNERIMPFIRTRIIGSIDIEAYVYESWYGQSAAERVDFYVDDVLEASVTTEPYLWTWTKKTIGKHTVKVIAYDYEGNSASKEIEVLKFL